MKKIIIFISLIFSVAISTEFEYDAAFDGWVDNREMQTEYLKSKTFLNSSIFLEAGFLFNSQHRIKFGANYFKDYGARKDWKNFSPIIYYQFKRKGDDLYFGIFNRDKMRKYPTALINDSLNTYRPFIEGLVYEKSGQIFKQNIWIDWTSMITHKNPSDREAFLTGFSGEFDFNAFYMNYYLVYYHVAHSKEHPKNEHVEDYGGLTVSIGKKIADFGFIDSLDLSLNGLLSYDRERFVDYSWHTPFGISLNAYLLLSPKWAINGEYYRGLWKDSEGWHGIPMGDQVYQASDFGLLEFIFLPFNNKNISSEFKFSFYFLDGTMDSRQMFRVNINLDNLKKLKNHRENRE